jgi:DNA excision repair protein ERCC-4
VQRTMTLELPPFVIAVDTREQLPYPLLGFATMRKTLRTGDYSIIGLENRVAVERKSYNDIWGSMSLGRTRFEKCVKRLAELEHAAIVIECGITQLATQPSYIQRTNAASVVGGLISWSVQYNIPVWTADTREQAEKITVRILGSFWKHRSGLYVPK